MQILLLLISLILAVLLFILPMNAVKFAIESQLFIYLAIIVVDYAKTKRFTMLQVWVTAFIFMILSEMLIISNSNQAVEYIEPMILFLLANNLVLLGYKMYTPSITNNTPVIIRQIANRPLFFLLSVLLTILFVWNSIDDVMGNIALGRQLEDTLGTTDVFDTLVESTGILLPSLVAFFYKDVKGPTKWLQLLFVIPIFAIHILLATRFKLLFSIVPYCVISGFINITKPTWKTNILMLVLVFASAMLSSFMKENRYMSFQDMSRNEFIDDENKNARWSVKLGVEMSPEGIIQVAKYADDYFKNHDLRYGLESTNLFYRWIPRKLWPNKPTTLDHWLIRYYEDVPDTHSTSSGFIGVFRADFGWFALVFAFLMGVLVAKIDEYMLRVCTYAPNSIEIVIATAMLPLVFFMVRSPITAAYTVLFEYIVYIIIKKITTTERKYSE